MLKFSWPPLPRRYWKNSYSVGLLLRAILWAILRRQTTTPRVPATTVAVVTTATLFGLLHIAQGAHDPALGVALFVSTFGIGLVFGAVTIRTGRLGPAILGHSLFNGASVLVGLAS